MKSQALPDGVFQVSLSYAEVVTLYELIARGEWSEDLAALEIVDRSEAVALSRLQMALQPLVNEAGTDDYGGAVRRAWAEIGEGGT